VKKAIVAILAIIYLGTASGIPVYAHYCMGELVSKGLGRDSQKKCPKCSMDKTKSDAKSCCKDESTMLKLEKDQKASEVFVNLLLPGAIDIPVAYYSIAPLNIFTLSEEYPVGHAPPGIHKVIFLLNCTFRV
jgi:hypothetical protein